MLSSSDIGWRNQRGNETRLSLFFDFADALRNIYVFADLIVAIVLLLPFSAYPTIPSGMLLAARDMSIVGDASRVAFNGHAIVTQHDKTPGDVAGNERCRSTQRHGALEAACQTGDATIGRLLERRADSRHRFHAVDDWGVHPHQPRTPWPQMNGIPVAGQGRIASTRIGGHDPFSDDVTHGRDR